MDRFSNQRKSWVSPFKNNSGSYAENGRATATDLRTSISISIPISTTGSSFSYLTPSLTPVRSAIPAPSFAPPSRTSKNFLSSADGTGQLGGSGWLIAADSIDFYSSQMFRDFQIVSNLQANGICVFDLDTMVVRTLSDEFDSCFLNDFFLNFSIFSRIHCSFYFFYLPSQLLFLLLFVSTFFLHDRGLISVLFGCGIFLQDALLICHHSIHLNICSIIIIMNM